MYWPDRGLPVPDDACAGCRAAQGSKPFRRRFAQWPQAVRDVDRSRALPAPVVSFVRAAVCADVADLAESARRPFRASTDQPTPVMAISFPMRRFA
jgi:hypothetical protein